jgi:hypothetical protein
MRPGLFDGDCKGIIVRLFPPRGTDVPGCIRRTAKNPAKEIAGRVEGICHRSQCGRLKFGLVAIAAAITSKLKLKTGICAYVSVIPGKLNERHENSLKVLM